MNDKDFKQLDDAMMKQMSSLREQKVNEGMLKGFSASVERKIQSQNTPVLQPVRRWAPVWAPTLAVMILASVVVLKSPMTSQSPLSGLSSSIELAQLVSSDDIQNDVAILKELGELTEEEEALFVGDDLEIFTDMESELSQHLRQSNIA